MRGCNEARPSRDLGEQGLQLQRASAESAKTRGASGSEPAALKVQLCEVPKGGVSRLKYEIGLKKGNCSLRSTFPVRSTNKYIELGSVPGIAKPGGYNQCRFPPDSERALLKRRYRRR